MVPKPDGSSRMCVDFRGLNDCTADASWPIFNISQMLRRIGQHKPTIFGSCDFLNGFHQAPMEEKTQEYTAFTCFIGIFQFTRLPFGRKRAPSYFQKVMASIVLAELIYHICEMYTDVFFGSSNEEFVSRVRQILLRFRKHNLYLKASKTYLGYKSLDFVGKVLSAEGLSMSQKKYNLY